MHASLYQEQVVERVRQMLFNLAELPVVRQQDGPACSAIFARIMEKQKIYGNISAINAARYALRQRPAATPSLPIGPQPF